MVCNDDLFSSQGQSLLRRDFSFEKGVRMQTEVIMIPYVISEDVALLLGAWAPTRGFQVPSQIFFEGWREEFVFFMQRMFPDVISVSEKEMTQGLSNLLEHIDLPVLSLDGVYVQADLSLELARQINGEKKEVGIGHRPGTPLLLHQVRKIQESGVREVALVDDVIFSGALIERVHHLLDRLGIRVGVVCAGVGMGEGVRRLLSHGYDVRCVRKFESVIDEVCERDFVPGVPQSGRAILGNDRVGAPYLLPFGDPIGWASIPPEHAKFFSAFCFARAIVLFEEIEHLSGQPVRCCDLSRFPIGLPQDNTRFVDSLRFLR
ncbi:MAG: hypothetical protein UX57_C0002G0019 [Candidatus Uhrbacteria bacterium GW2011_GWE2_46_68]|uniref:Phosphoribosyltransferase domain-containing protein n=2 Tax=Candidatus Uhriibacteriota TaxID=1752732 RepID=A0A0G1T8D3_9BACT|nr:MAG: hypothetical protein UX57_C0002G0019 [Candidatus Uhrbacteria bacterium GW2011_GWE2_46_68]